MGVSGSTKQSERNSLLLKLIKIFAVNSESLEFTNFGGLDILYLISFVVNFLSDLSSLLEIIKSLLFLDGIVFSDLATDFVRVLHKSVFLLLLDLSLLVFNLLLFLDLIHVVLALNSGLLSKTRLLLWELFLSGNLKIGLDSLSLLGLESFPLPGLSLTFLECSLSSKSINLSLSISSFFLKFSKPLDFLFLLVLDSGGFELSIVFLLILGPLIFNDGHLVVFLLLSTLLLLNKGLRVSLSSLLH